MRRITTTITTAFAMMGALAALGCGKKGAPPVAAQLPQVTTAAALAMPDVPRPAAIVLLDASGGLRVGLPPASWAIELAKEPKGSLPVDLPYLRQIAAELRAGIPLAGILREGPNQLADLEDPPPPEPEDDEPPPPEPEEDEADDESGGTGTAMVLEEGKMGKKDSDRAEGQYNMKRNVDHEQLARAQAIEQARHGGGFVPAARPGGGFTSITSGDDGPTRETQLADRLAKITGAIAEDGRLDAATPRMLVAADPAARAPALIDVLAATSGLLAVHHQGALRVLRLDLAPRRDTAMQLPDREETWLEVRLGAGGLAFEVVPETPTPVAWPAGAPLDAAAVATTWKQVRAQRGLDTRTDVDVLVAADVDVQRLIDLLVALDAAGARTIGLGALPADDSPAAKHRGRRIPRLALGQPQSVGDLDRAIIRRYIKRNVAKLETCHTQALAIDPDVTGTVMVQFFIAPTGTVDTAAANGGTPALAECVRTVIEGIEFPKPQGGGGVQVNYPFRFTH